MFEIAITWTDIFSWAVYAISSFGLSKFFKKFNVLLACALRRQRK